MIAINAQIADPQLTGTNANAGVGFAIPIDLAKRALKQPRAGQAGIASLPRHPRRRAQQLGRGRQRQAAGPRPADRRRRQGLSRRGRGPQGRLAERSRSARKSYCVGGDVITAINGHAVNTLEDLQSRISSYAAGDKLRLSGDGRRRRKRSVTVTVGSMPVHHAATRDRLLEADHLGGETRGARYAGGVIARYSRSRASTARAASRRSLRR